MRVGFTRAGHSLFASLTVGMRFSIGRTTLCRLANKARVGGRTIGNVQGKPMMTEMESSYPVRRISEKDEYSSFL